MHFQNGSYRFVFVMPSMRLVIKIPRIRIGEFWMNARSNSRGLFTKPGQWRYFWKTTFAQSSDYPFSGRRLFKGFVDNWREWRFWRETRHPVLAPMYFWFGCTLQQYAKPLVVQSGTELFDRLQPLCEGLRGRDPHHFTNPANFGELNGHLVVVDYASPKVQSILRVKGDVLVREYDVRI